MGSDRPANQGDAARLFVAVTLPPDVEETVAALPRPEVAGVRWTQPHQWHVTLRFLGRESSSAVAAALGGLDHGPARAVFDREVTTLGRGVLCVRVDGLDDLAAAVVDRTQDLGEPPDPRPFVGHVTLARVNRRAPPVASLGSAPVAPRSWVVREVELVRSDLHADGARYTTVARLPLRA